MAGNNSISNHTFFDKATSIGVGKDFYVTSNASEMNIKFECIGTFQAKITADIHPKNENEFFSYPCIKYPECTLIDDIISDSNAMYNVKITGIDCLRIEIITLNGILSAYGKAVG